MNVEIYTSRGCWIEPGRLPQHKGLASVGFTADAVAKIAQEVETVYKRKRHLCVDDAITEVIPNVDLGDVFVCSYDLRKAVYAKLTKGRR